MYGYIIVLLCLTLDKVTSDVLVYSLDTEERMLTLKDVPSRFGESIPPDGIKGFLVYAEPSNGCTAIKPRPLDDGAKWFVLIRRYDCNFDVKVRNAQLAGYDAAIVHNVNSSELEPMGAAHPAGIKIPSVFISDESGQILRDFYQWTSGYFIVIDDGLPFNINTHLLLPFLVVVGLCIIVMVIFLVVKCIKDRRRQRRHRLPRSSLKKIPVHKFKKGEDSYEVCAICLEDYVDNDKLRVLPCSHAYHCVCIDPWLTKNRRVCPVCKRKVFASGDAYEDSDTEDERAPLVRNEVSGYGGTQSTRSSSNPILNARRTLSRLRNHTSTPAASAPTTTTTTTTRPTTISSSDSSVTSSEYPTSSSSTGSPNTGVPEPDTRNPITNLNPQHSINSEVTVVTDRTDNNTVNV